MFSALSVNWCKLNSDHIIYNYILCLSRFGFFGETENVIFLDERLDYISKSKWFSGLCSLVWEGSEIYLENG